MNTKHGLRGAIVPPGPFKNKEESLQFERFPIEIRDGVIEIGFDDKADEVRARDIVRQYLHWFSVEHGVRHTADLNQSREMKPGAEKTICIELNATGKVSAGTRVTRATIGATSRIAPAYDSAALATYSALVEKSQRSTALANALKYFNEEVIDDDKPLYGIYKAIEELAHAAGGRGTLAQLVNQLEKYVGDVMETTQTTRHRPGYKGVRQLLSDQGCRERARILIEVYAKSI